ncbi:unnamed protein product [Allacma fusca]|uniref:Uncharacterized protein n=1 Tax=Allacma fusca TaxID=39272 RepID=A0A8J2L0K3_9HEXA|nr:unnamed protein product [Allacma fusca]
MLLNSAGVYALGPFVMLSTFEKIHWAARIQIASLGLPRKLTKSRVEKAFNLCRRLQLTTQMFNKCFANINFCCKAVSATVSLWSFYFVFRYIDLHPYISYVTLMIGLECVLGIVIMFDKAFRLPEQNKELKGKIVVISSRLPLGSVIIKKKIQSVPNLGFMDGSFSLLARNSSPTFVNFVATNLVGLLVSF